MIGRGATYLAARIKDGELRAADGEQPADPGGVQRYLAKAFGEHLDDVREAIEELADRYEPAALNRIGFRLYEKFRPDVPPDNEGWGTEAVLEVECSRAIQQSTSRPLRRVHPLGWLNRPGCTRLCGLTALKLCVQSRVLGVRNHLACTKEPVK